MENRSDARAPLRILYLEDSPEDAELVRRLFAGPGGEGGCVDRAATEREFSSFLGSRVYDVILTDFNIPGFDGFSSLRLAAALRPEVPVICVSGGVGEETAVELFKAGVSDFVRKDNLARLPLAVERAVGEAARKKALTRAEKALRESEAELKAAQRMARIGSWTLDNATGQIFWTEELYRMLGLDLALPPPDLAGHSRLFTPGSWDRLRAAVERARETGAPYEIELEMVRPDGRKGWMLASGEPVPDAAGAIAGLRGTAQDITERKLADEEREKLRVQFLQSQKLETVGRLAGGVAHDFNNLLTAIMGYAGFLLKSLAPEDKRREDVEEILKAAESAAALTRQLLAFSRRQILRLRVLDCNTVIRDTQKLLTRLIGENITMELDLAEEECRANADPGQLEQILMNLVVNARDAMPNGGKVVIKTENTELGEKHSRMHMELRPGPHVMISVSDTGCGMAPDVMARVFEPFFTTKEAGKGTGLGLATVYGIVKQSGGNIYVYSEPGLGTTFKIYLPRVTEKIAAGAAPVKAEALRGSETILLAEDDDGMRGFALRALRENGYTVLEARDAEEAVRLCESRACKIDLVLTDTIMPGLNGHELHKKLLKRCPEVKVVFMSGYTDTELGNVRLAAANLPFLQKPFSADALTAKVRETLDSRRSQPAV